MDPFTHGIIGLGIGALSGQPLSPYNPVYGAAVLGAVSPDLDIVTMLSGDLAFLRNHRGISHSLVGLLLLSIGIAGIFFLDFGGNPLIYFLWAFAGAISHSLLDSLNSYGTQLWWPFSKKRCYGNLLMFFDPFLIFLFLPVFFTYRTPQKAAFLALGLMVLYLFLRLLLRINVERYIRKKFNLSRGNTRLAVLPALNGLITWDFFIEAPREIILGTLNSFGLGIRKKLSLKKKESTPLIIKAMKTIPGKFFSQFTFFYHINCWKEKNKHYVKLTDLRFQNKTDFFYKLTMIFNEQFHLEDAYFYRMGEVLPVDIFFRKEIFNEHPLEEQSYHPCS